MNEWQFYLFLGALAAASFAIPAHNLRGVVWICVGCAVFVVTTAYQRLGLPYHPFFTGMCDATVCLAIYCFAKYRWEQWVFVCFQAMVLVGAVHMLGFADSRYVYVALLEVCNWAGLLVITGGTVEEMVRDGSAARWVPRGRLRRVVRSVLPSGWTDEA